MKKVIIVVLTVVSVMMLMSCASLALESPSPRHTEPEAFYCPGCGEILGASINRLDTRKVSGHVKDASCMVERIWLTICRKCGEVIKEVQIGTNTHSCNWDTPLAAACGETIYQEGTCVYCGEVTKRELGVQQHNLYIQSIQREYGVVRCSNCDEYGPIYFKNMIGMPEHMLPYTTKKSLSTTGRNYYYYCDLDVQIVCDDGYVVSINY